MKKDETTDLTKFRKEISDNLRDARDDAEAILCSLGVVAQMTAATADLAQQISRMPWDDEFTRQAHGYLVPSAAEVLRKQRERIGELLDELGDWFNARDAVSGSMQDVSAPVYEVFHKRDRGETLDD